MAANASPASAFISAHHHTLLPRTLPDLAPPPHTHTHSADGVWHMEVEGLPSSGVLYGFRVAGKGGWETGYRWDSSKVTRTE